MYITLYISEHTKNNNIVMVVKSEKYVLNIDKVITEFKWVTSSLLPNTTWSMQYSMPSGFNIYMNVYVHIWYVYALMCKLANCSINWNVELSELSFLFVD